MDFQRTVAVKWLGMTVQGEGPTRTFHRADPGTGARRQHRPLERLLRQRRADRLRDRPADARGVARPRPRQAAEGRRLGRPGRRHRGPHALAGHAGVAHLHVPHLPEAVVRGLDHVAAPLEVASGAAGPGHGDPCHAGPRSTRSRRRRSISSGDVEGKHAGPVPTPTTSTASRGSLPTATPAALPRAGAERGLTGGRWSRLRRAATPSSSGGARRACGWSLRQPRQHDRLEQLLRDTAPINRNGTRARASPRSGTCRPSPAYRPAGELKERPRRWGEGPEAAPKVSGEYDSVVVVQPAGHDGGVIQP